MPPPTTIPGGWSAQGVHPVGYRDLDGRPGFKMAIREAQGRWWLYVAHFWDSGWTVLDVTDPTAPNVVAFLPGPDNTATLQVDLCDDIMVTALERHIPGFGGDLTRPHDEGVIIWSLEDPAAPRRLGQFRTGGTGTHRNGYPGGRYVHLTANMAGYSGNIYVIVDIADPAHPVEVGRWWVPGPACRRRRAAGQTRHLAARSRGHRRPPGLPALRFGRFDRPRHQRRRPPTTDQRTVVQSAIPDGVRRPQRRPPPRTRRRLPQLRGRRRGQRHRPPMVSRRRPRVRRRHLRPRRPPTPLHLPPPHTTAGRSAHRLSRPPRMERPSQPKSTLGHRPLRFPPRSGLICARLSQV